MFGLGADREVCGDREPRRLCFAGAHAARARHHGRLRPAQERKPEGTRLRPPRAIALGGTGADAFVTSCACEERADMHRPTIPLGRVEICASKFRGGDRSPPRKLPRPQGGRAGLGKSALTAIHRVPIMFSAVRDRRALCSTPDAVALPCGKGPNSGGGGGSRNPENEWRYAAPMPPTRCWEF